MTVSQSRHSTPARATRDGFAFRSGSSAPLKLVSKAMAGTLFSYTVCPGECVAISAGAIVPEGCDTVVSREQCSQEEDRIWLGALLRPGANMLALDVAA